MGLLGLPPKVPGGPSGAVRAAGAITLGVEEEFVLLDPSTGATVLAGPDLVRMLDGEPGVLKVAACALSSCVLRSQFCGPRCPLAAFSGVMPGLTPENGRSQ